MQITIEYAAQIKRAAGQASETFECDEPCTVQEAVERVAKRHGEELESLLFDGHRQLHPSILLFTGDTQIRWDEPKELRDGDVLTILSPISGG